MEMLLTLITGLCFLVGYFLGFICKSKEKLSVLGIAISFIVLLNLIFFDILPETLEDFSFYSFLIILLGLFILKILDFIVPSHHHNHKEENDDKKEHNLHQEHLSIITILALSIHNILEAMALYNIAKKSLSSGLIMALAIAFHNIPLGLQIASGLQKRKIFYLLALSLSGFIGGILCLFIPALPHQIENYILCFTLGMLIYLTVFEFFVELWHNRKNIYTLYGIIIGIILVVITTIL